jgi:hypothetical protein
MLYWWCYSYLKIREENKYLSHRLSCCCCVGKEIFHVRARLYFSRRGDILDPGVTYEFPTLSFFLSSSFSFFFFFFLSTRIFFPPHSPHMERIFVQKEYTNLIETFQSRFNRVSILLNH